MEASFSSSSSWLRWLGLVLALAAPACGANNRDLLRAIRDNNPAMVNIALKAGDRHSAVDDSGDTPLLLAVRLDKYKALKALIKAKADLSATDAAGYTAMHIAADVGGARSIQVCRRFAAREPLPSTEPGASLQPRPSLPPHRAVAVALLRRCF